MREPGPTVYVVDDDPDVLRAIERLLDSIGLQVATFSSPHEFLESFDRSAPGCLVLDLSLPGLNGLDVQRTLAQQASVLPIVFLTGRGDIAASVQAMKLGAADFLTKPIDDTALIAAVRHALARDQVVRPAQLERERIAKCLATLTERERQVLALIVAGRLNKQIAAELGTTEKTIKFHRGNLMRKMGVRVVADLVKLAERAGDWPPRPAPEDAVPLRSLRYLDQGPVWIVAAGCYRGLTMAKDAPLLAVVDDDADVRAALTRLVASAGFAVETFASGAEFLRSVRGPRAGLRRARPAHAGNERIRRAGCARQRASFGASHRHDRARHSGIACARHSTGREGLSAQADQRRARCLRRSATPSVAMSP